MAQIPFTGDLTAAYYAATDPETPAFVRAWLLAALGYFIIPTDAMPDFLFGIGFTDDAAVLATTMQMIFTHITPEHQQRAAAALAEVRAGERQDPFQEPPK
ncbi:MAG: DUF1232 domain-containing protein [Alphaproteobacteria bacterium]|nr:DUF1232 domain-containing protein [Alphaproteobacteria bacterium SS10]